ncbi:MAG TPA: AAA family ATPase [Ktedonobacterales bacterium]|jgi:predicted kinase
MMKRSRLYIVFGIPFSGKSTIVRELVRQRGCRVIDIDAINTARGVGIAGAPITPEDWAISFTSAGAQLDDALAAGESVAYDGHVWSRAQRKDFRTLAAAAGAAITFIYLDVPEAVARERWQANRKTAQRHNVPDDLFTQAVGLMEPPDETESVMRYDGVTPVETWVAALP